VSVVTALVLINTERDRVNLVAEHLVMIDGVTEVFSVAGKYDLIAMIRVPNNEAMAELVTGSILEVDGITESETLLAFRVHSKFDLAGLFDVDEEQARN
jgi:DNA-binding Lrp family transcriptional regulator